MKPFEFEAKLTQLIQQGDTQAVLGLMNSNFGDFFASPDIFKYYQLVKAIDPIGSASVLPILTKAWLAFLTGDNLTLQGLFKELNPDQLDNPQVSSCYYALRALMGIGGAQEASKYAKLSLDVLPPQDKSFYMANAKLTYGQLLASQDQFRSAAQLFHDSYQLFDQLEMPFPALVALVNEQLNRYKLGQYLSVINHCSEALKQVSSFRADTAQYWQILNLPLGMCYFELNKPSLALQHLTAAKVAIDSLNMFHMHGLCEQYMFKCCYLLQDQRGMEDILAQVTRDFGPMHHPFTDLLISALKLMQVSFRPAGDLQADAERFELEYIKNRDKCSLLVLENLACLQLTGFSSALSLEDIGEVISRLRFTGMIPALQQFLVVLAQLQLEQGRVRPAQECLKEAVALYREHGGCVCFFFLPLQATGLLKELEPGLFNQLDRRFVPIQPQQAILSQREREIMALVAAGKSNQEISQQLFIGVGTIKWHLNHVFAKLEVENRLQAAEKAKTLGEIPT